jgi:predicted ATPase/DNA-binding CsgD family transcriptional regulator/DNA-binding XRE family transcriptional regulator
VGVATRNLTRPADLVTPARLASRRRGLGLSQQELGKGLGVSRNTVARWERGALRIGRPEWLGMALTRLESHGGRASGRMVDAQATADDQLIHLPAELSSFVGRETEVAECAALLRTERLVTLTGVGGIGKSRLAARVARSVAGEFLQGVYLVELQALEDPLLVLRAVAAPLGIFERVGDSLVDLLIETLRAQKLLLVLDDCDNVVEECGRLAYQLLRAAPSLAILATSREPLDVEGEIAWRVPPLMVSPPDATFETIAGVGAVQLFVQRTHAVAPWFKLTEANAAGVAYVCRRLDGIPLALELAASRMKILTVDQLIQRLESGMEILHRASSSVPSRQQTLKATIDFSYMMLTEAERVMFRRASVFAGGWTLEAAERVTVGEPLTSHDVLWLLERLIDRSLVVGEEREGTLRQSMPHTVREYAHDRLRESGEEDRVQRRHFDWLLDNVKSVNPDTLSAREIASNGLELDNLRSAWGWSIDAGETGLALHLAAVAGKIWNYRGDLAEGVSWMRRTLDLPGADDLPQLRSLVFKGLGALSYSLGDMAGARAALSEGCASIAGDASEREPPLCCHLQGDVAFARGDLAEALFLYQRALAEYHTLGRRFWEEAMLALTASVLFEQGDAAASRAACDRCLAFGRGRAFSWATARARVVLAYLAAHEGDAARAERLAAEALALLRAMQEPTGIAIALRALSDFALEQGRLGDARTWLTEALDIASAEGNNMGLARTLETVACVLACGARAAAARIAGAASQLRSRTGTVPWPTEQARLTRWLDMARHKIGAEAFTEDWTRGETLSRSEATAAARRFLDELPASSSPGAAVSATSPLTARQREVVALVARGLTNEQIANELVISPATARAHVEHVFDRLDLHSRAQIAAWATAHELGETIAA